jgi:hypothetical protein
MALADIADPEDVGGNCTLGITESELREALGEDYDHFTAWMMGQTGAICEGVRWDWLKREYVPSGCGPHGYVVYRSDFVRYVQGRRR